MEVERTTALADAVKVSLRRSVRRLFRGSYAGIVGGFFGMSSLFLNWIYQPMPVILIPIDRALYVAPRMPWAGPWFTGLEVIQTDWSGVGLGILIFALGSLVVIFWRVGFVAQACGLFVFLLEFRSISASAVYAWSPELHASLASGYVVALAGFLVAAFGGIEPIWRRMTPTVTPAVSRIAVLSPNALRQRH